jgi:hypothetical protein
MMRHNIRCFLNFDDQNPANLMMPRSKKYILTNVMIVISIGDIQGMSA